MVQLRDTAGPAHASPDALSATICPDVETKH
ncbi:hypothetical protein CBM2595_A80377 [Cupriavidus taiwanensis]|uniref:Uncharacterized protein n=1 Tax=Cupriavidus taiwanensis TaxID=164546 RepID=A0A7Z7J882_9BURK|nr:hypothetical protein CBM2595_A80377 [Cupriavidus taiwanensis]SPC15714.1 hypothetical protein CBM2594_A70279 [Cupriavidus taiwanensis]